MRKALILVLVAIVGALAGLLLRIPAGLFVGSMTTVAAAELLAPRLGRPPALLGDVGKLLVGTAVGATFNREMVRQLGTLLPPSILASAVLVVVGALLGWALSRLSGLDIATAMFCLTPGGIAEMVAVADELDVDSAVIAAVQFLRLTGVLILAPALVRWLFV